jgi:hypothetical protein
MEQAWRDAKRRCADGQKAEQMTKERQLFLGLLLGIVIGALWEAIRR